MNSEIWSPRLVAIIAMIGGFLVALLPELRQMKGIKMSIIKPVKLAKSPKPNHVLNYKGETVEAVTSEGSRYFENHIINNTPLTPDFMGALSALLVEASASPIITSGNYSGTGSPKGTVRGNETLQNQVQALCESSKISFEYVTDLLKSVVAGLDGAKAPFNYEAELAQLTADYDADVADLNKSLAAVDDMVKAGMSQAVIDQITATTKNALAMREEVHASDLKKLEQRRKQSETAQKNKENKS